MQEAIVLRAENSVVPNTGGTKQTILLVEDEDMVRELLCEVLERAGYEVLPCADPGEGIAVCGRYPGKIDLLLTDVVMPGMNGREMASRILESEPELHIVFMSGYTEHVLLQARHMETPFEYLQKPFSMQTLTQKLARVLGPVSELTMMAGQGASAMILEEASSPVV